MACRATGKKRTVDKFGWNFKFRTDLDSGGSTFLQRGSPPPPPWRLLPESLERRAEFIFTSKSSMYTANRMGEIMPPFRTPASKGTGSEKQAPHLTTVKDFSSQQFKMLINLKGQFRASNLLKSV